MSPFIATRSTSLMLTSGSSPLLPYHANPWPDLSVSHRREPARVQFIGLLYVHRAYRANSFTHSCILVKESRSLVLGPTDEEALTSYILRIAFSDPCDATNPVLQGVLALASLQLHGSAKSFRFKRLALSSIMQESSVSGDDEKALLQNLIATMLLYHYEVVQSAPQELIAVG